MIYTPLAPFRRAMAAADLVSPDARTGGNTPDKWEVLAALTTARRHFGVTDRDLSVLRALLSFYPHPVLDGALIVYPSNAALCERLHGMPNSTMRRHLAKLQDAGLIGRRDSPNGKRYTRQIDGEKIAFGLDLAPLARRWPEIAGEAAQTKADHDAFLAAREAASLMRRDLSALADLAEEHGSQDSCWADYRKTAITAAKELRGCKTLSDLNLLTTRLQEQITAAQAQLSSLLPKLSTSEIETEQHIQNKKNNLSESVCYETTQRPIEAVLSNCSEIQAYRDEPIKDWDDLHLASEHVRPMMGITTETWQAAKRQFGASGAAILLSTMLQKFDRLRSPGAYLRHLTKLGQQRRFNPRSLIPGYNGTAGSEFTAVNFQSHANLLAFER